MSAQAARNINDILSALNASRIRYALCRDLENVLPSQYTGNTDIDIVVHKNDWARVKAILNTQNWFEVLHPFDNLSDFIFLYGVTPFRFYIKGSAKLDICFELACRSTNAGEWIPLDQEIQESVWVNRQWDEVRQCYSLSPIDECLHLLARAYFDKKHVSKTYRKRLQHLFSNVNVSDLQHRLKLVFFGASSEVLECIQQNKFDDLVTRVTEFNDY